MAIFKHRFYQGFLWLLGFGFYAILILAPSFAQNPNGYAIEDQVEAARTYMVHQRWDFASYEWRNVLAQDPKSLEAHLGLAESLFKQGLTADAVQHLEDTRKVMTSAKLEIALAEDYFNLKAFDKAGQVLIALLQKNPYEPQAFKALNSFVAKLPAALKDQADKLLRTQADEAKTKAKAAVKSNDFALASRYYEVVSDYSQRFGDVNDYGVLLFLSGNRQGAVSQLELINHFGGVACESHANEAIVVLSMRQFDLAQRMAQDELGRCQNLQIKPKLYNNLGYIYELSNQWTKAKFAYEKAIELDPHLTKALMNLGYIYQRNREYDDAINLFHQYLTHDHANAEVWNQLGFTYELNHKPKHAMEAYKTAIHMNPGFKEPYYNLAVVYRKLDKFKEANKALKRMNEMEFSQMENTRNGPTGNPKQELIFDYVDLFFSELVF